MSCRTASGSLTSHGLATAPIASAVASSASAATSDTTTVRAPSATNRRANAWPMPPAAPVITTHVPSSFMTRSPCSSDRSRYNERQIGTDAARPPITVTACGSSDDSARVRDAVRWRRRRSPSTPVSRPCGSTHRATATPAPVSCARVMRTRSGRPRAGASTTGASRAASPSLPPSRRALSPSRSSTAPSARLDALLAADTPLLARAFEAAGNS